MRAGLVMMGAVLLAGCGSGNSDAGNVSSDVAPASGAAVAGEPRWTLESTDAGTTLALLGPSGDAAVRLICPAGGTDLIVNVPEFEPIGSEERMSFGSGGEVVALVADTEGDRQRGGVSGTGEVPVELASLIRGPIGVNYGARNSGPHPAPPAPLAQAFLAACGVDPGPAVEGGGAPIPLANGTAGTMTAAAAGVSACLMQGSERLQVEPLRAVGTEPFWGARIEGRCVTYSHPEDQQGTRVWTRYTPAPDGGGTWAGALGGARFELRIRPDPDCSDGMSDRLYPLAAELLVRGETRRGCAAPA